MGNFSPELYSALQITLGSIAVILAVAVWIYYTFAIALMIFLFAFALIFIGVSVILAGVGGETLPPWRRSLEIVFGSLSIVIAILTIAFPLTGISLLITLLGIGLIIIGVSGIVSGISNTELPEWHRALYITIGVLLFILSIIVLMNPTLGTIIWNGILPIPGNYIPPLGFYYVIPSLGYLLLVFLLSMGLAIRGIQSIIAGIKRTE
ncbi:MAG: DUF308 domain-containing protein [Candidatus Jordarchaeaceae archaeon]